MIHSVAYKLEEYIGEWHTSSYYTPLPGQSRYHAGSYEADMFMNTQGDPYVTANGHRLSEADVYKKAACPPNMTFGTKLRIQMPAGHPREHQSIMVECVDRGGAIKGRRLDLWAGIGESAWIGKWSSKRAKVYKLTQ